MNLKINDLREPISSITLSAAIPTGQVFTGKIGSYEDRLFVMSYKRGIVSLGNPLSGYWTGNDVPVSDYHPVEIAEITLRSQAKNF